MFRKLAGLTAIAGLFFVSTASAQITGTAHDFSGQAWTTNGEICVVCHTPHNTLVTLPDAPLWNHTQSTTDFTGNLYGSTTLQVVPGNPTGVSRLCLSCHDGSVALDSFGGATGGTTISGNALIGTTLANDHPVSFTWTAANAGPEIRDPTTASSTILGGGTIAVDLLFGATNDQMECASCHDVHGTANPSLLRVDNGGSDFCLVCHIK